MVQNVDALLEGLLEATLRLKQVVMRKDAEPDEWLPILDEREVLIGAINATGLTASVLTDNQRMQLKQINQINQSILPLIDARKLEVEQKLNNLQRSKLAMNTYNNVGPSGYGAFFDRKK